MKEISSNSRACHLLLSPWKWTWGSEFFVLRSTSPLGGAHGTPGWEQGAAQMHLPYLASSEPSYTCLCCSSLGPGQPGHTLETWLQHLPPPRPPARSTRKESNHHTRHQRDRPALLRSPVECAANTLNQATKIHCRRDSTPRRGVHRGAGNVTEHAVRGQQLGLK